MPQKWPKAMAMAGTRLERVDMYIQTHIIYMYLDMHMQLASGVVYRGSSAAAAAMLLLYVC